MWQKIGILVGGYGFIVFSYVWVWVIVAGMSRSVSADRMERLRKTDVKAVGMVLACWTILWGFLVLLGRCG